MTTSIIKDNRIVSSHTFAVRFLLYLAYNYNGGNFTHQMLEEEYEYMVSVAIKLLKLQIETCPPVEEWYFNNLDKNWKDYKSVIKNHICANNPDFYNYLIKANFI